MIRKSGRKRREKKRMINKREDRRYETQKRRRKEEVAYEACFWVGGVLEGILHYLDL